MQLGFERETVIHEGPNTVIRRARRKHDGAPVVLKSLNTELLSPANHARLRHEFELLNLLLIPGVVRALELVQEGSTPVLVLEDTGSRVLKREIGPTGLPLERFFPIALMLARAVGEIHHTNIIHKHINPFNVVIHPETGLPTLIDFANASRLPREHAALQAPHHLNGPLPYLAPEQTGRMNRTVDWRSDLYSLGATFYELLSGRPPFEAAEPLATMHALLARAPVPPHEVRPGLHPLLSAIVLKLLAKEPEERYQSALALIHDLERAQRVLLEEGNSGPFELATRDIAFRFHIPQKLYGREAHVADLLSAFERVAQGQVQFLIVTGDSGIGKSTLVHEIHKPIATRQGYFSEGKFDQFQRDVPYGPLMRALRSVLQQLLTENEARVQRVREQLTATLGSNAGLLAGSLPELTPLIDHPADVPEDLRTEETRHRVSTAFVHLLQALATEEHPLTLFLDDLQWADLASLDLLERLLANKRTRYLLLLGAYRDNEVSTSHPLAKLLTTLKAEDQAVTRIILGPLTADHVKSFLTDLLHQNEEEVWPLAEFIHERTQGNPFFVREFVSSLHETGKLYRSSSDDMWRWDLDAIRMQGVTANIAAVMTQRIGQLPAEAQEILQLASCIGNVFDVQALASVSGRTVAETTRALYPTIQMGLVVPMVASCLMMRGMNVDGPADAEVGSDDPSICRFVHDHVQQTAYLQVPQANRAAVHLRIGRFLVGRLGSAEQDERLFETVQQLNVGVALVTDADERERMAQLNLQAGLRAKRAAAFQPAREWFRLGRDLLRPDAWENQYELALPLYSEGAEVARILVQFPEMDALSAEVIFRARTILDRVPIHEMRIQQHTAQNRPTEALDTARLVLRELGIRLPPRPTRLHVMTGLASTLLAMRRRNGASLQTLPRMTDPSKLAAIRVLTRTISAAYIASPNAFPFVIFEIVRLSLRYGNCAHSAVGYMLYGTLISVILKREEQGYDLGRFALDLLKRFQARELEPRLLVGFNISLSYLKSHLRASLEPLRQAYLIGQETGDLEYVCHAAMCSSGYLVWLGDPLEQVQAQQEEFLAAIERNKADFHAVHTRISLQLVSCLRGQAEDSRSLVGKAFNERSGLPLLRETNNLTCIFLLLACKAMLCYVHGDARTAFECATQARNHERAALGTFDRLENIFYQSLSLLACYSERTARQRHTLSSNRSTLRKLARLNAANFGARHHLVEAEFARVKGRSTEAMLHYEQATASALKEGYSNVAAISEERYGRYLIELGLRRAGTAHITEAVRLYQHWGAIVKVEALKRENLHGTNRLPAPVPSAPSPTHHSLDLTTILGASRAISEEILIDALLRKLVRLLIESAGAERGVLILENEGTLLIEAEICANDQEVTHLTAAPVEAEEQRLSPAILNYVVRTGESMVLHEATIEGLFTADPYVVRVRPRSVLCAPLVNQGRLIAVIYLENNLVAGAFMEERLEVLRLLLSQAALSIHNARLYSNLDASKRQLEEYSHTLEEKVEARTQELRGKNEELASTLRQLRETQAQLVQQEKLVSLGSLTAGIAHEIKNPLNFVINFSLLSEQLVDELGEQLRSQQARLEQGSHDDLKDIVAQLRLNVDRIKEHGERASGIIASMLMHSQGPSPREPADFNVVVAKSVEFALNGVRARMPELQVQLEADYDPGVGLVELAEQSITRVVINLVDNALFALNDKRQKFGMGERLWLRVRTRARDGRVELRIWDNGTGIPTELLDKIFNPFFTTKPAGQGTGLGLSLCHDIVVRGHQGSIQVDSKIGMFSEFVVVLPKQVSTAARRVAS